MFREYALEPAVLCSWDRTRFFLDAFGPWKGRFLAEYPGKWKAMVLKGLDCPDVERLRVVERLAQIDKRVFSQREGFTYDGTRAWIENADLEHQRLPFTAIVAVAPSPKAHVLNAAEVDDRHDAWRVDIGRFVARDAQAFVQTLQPLLATSRRIVIVDPYFRADQDDKTSPLVAFCRSVFGRATVEVHFSDETRSYDLSMRDAARVLPKILPDGMKVSLHCWKERKGGQRFHNRYILTEVGGVKFGDGIELGHPGQEDHLSILDETSRARLWEQYLGATPAFDAAGLPQECVGKNR